MEAIEKVKTNYKDDIINTTVSEKRRYNLIQNSDGTVSLEDVTEYVQIGDTYGAEQINAENQAINSLIDGTSNIDNTADSVKRVSYADSAGSATRADNATYATSSGSAASATTANSAVYATTAGSAETAGSSDNDFILLNQGTLSFNNKTCNIANTKITEDSLADVYFTSDTILYAERAVISVETYDGGVRLTAGRTPESTIKATIKIRKV